MLRMPIAIVIGSFVIAGAILWANRWQVVLPPDRAPMLYDRWFGVAYDCRYLNEMAKEPWRLACSR
jgi:hypothetical protein